MQLKKTTKILSSADWHINLHRKKIPVEWQQRRYELLFEKLRGLETDCDVHVIAGDLFDEEPDTDEVCLLLSYLNSVQIPTLVIPGNHEATSRGNTFWKHFQMKDTIVNPLVRISTENERICLAGQYFCTFPYGSVQTNKLPQHVSGDILVTHIRGEVPPHISAEFDFERLRPWGLVLLGDLHFRHRHKDYNAYYPGSPLNTTFDRDDNKQYGVDIIHYIDEQNYKVEFVDLQLPKLIRKTVDTSAELKHDPVNHVIYEVTGSIDELARVKKTDNIDKKMVEKPTSAATLDLKNKSIIEELQLWLDHVKISDTASVIEQYKQLGIQ